MPKIEKSQCALITSLKVDAMFLGNNLDDKEGTGVRTGEFEFNAEQPHHICLEYFRTEPDLLIEGY